MQGDTNNDHELSVLYSDLQSSINEQAKLCDLILRKFGGHPSDFEKTDNLEKQNRE